MRSPFNWLASAGRERARAWEPARSGHPLVVDEQDLGPLGRIERGRPVAGSELVADGEVVAVQLEDRGDRLARVRAFLAVDIHLLGLVLGQHLDRALVPTELVRVAREMERGAV